LTIGLIERFAAPVALMQAQVVAFVQVSEVSASLITDNITFNLFDFELRLARDKAIPCNIRIYGVVNH
jgi:hypothetical protein